MEKFDDEVMPEIEALLQTEDPGYAEYYFSVVMVGLRQATAKPKILVSCTNADVRTEILRIIKSSHHIRDMYPQFGFGESSVPLHEPMPSVPLAGRVKSRSRTTPEDNVPALINVPSTKASLQQSRVVEVSASDHNPSIGRKLFVSSTENEPARYATGGIVVRIGDKYYQKTVGHIDESECGPIPQSSSPDDIDYCRFDDDSDEEDDYMFQFDSDITSRGSMTPEDSLSRADSFDGSDTASFGLTAGPSSPGDRWQYPQSESLDAIDGAHESLPSDDNMGSPPGLTSVGRLEHNSRAGKKPGLDYGFVRLNDRFDPEKVNRICVDSTTNTHVQIRGVEPIAAVERDIVTVTASGGITHGKIMPSAVYFRNPKQGSFQKLYVVHLSTVVVDGDCGADVVDAKTGSLYGHIVRGCRGTQITYIVSAKDVFEDLEDRLGIAPEIVLPGQTRVSAKRGTENHSKNGLRHVQSQEQSDTHPYDDCNAELDMISRKVPWPTFQVVHDTEGALQKEQHLLSPSKNLDIGGLDSSDSRYSMTPAASEITSYPYPASFEESCYWKNHNLEPSIMAPARESWPESSTYSLPLLSYSVAMSEFPGVFQTSSPYLQSPPPFQRYEVSPPASHDSRPHAARRRQLAWKGEPERWSRTATPSPTASNSAFDFASRDIVLPGQTKDVAKHDGDNHCPPARMGGPGTAVKSQDDKRRRRRESHNAVERRRRDNINERIQDLATLVPGHRLDDKKIKKLFTNGTPLSPTLTGIAHPDQATSALAGPGAKRATGGGSITTGLPIDDNDKRMQTELIEVMSALVGRPGKNEALSYTRTDGSYCNDECGSSPGQMFSGQSAGRSIQIPKSIRQVSERKSLLSTLLASQAAFAKALTQMHQNHDKYHEFGRHGDLKPENILWFKPDGALPISDLGIALVDRRPISGSSSLSGPREVIIGDEPHASGTFGSSSSRLRSAAVTYRSKQEWKDFVNKSRLPSRSFDASAKVNSVAKRPGTGDGRLPWEFVGYNSRDEALLLEDTERWDEHIIIQHLAHELLKMSASWFCDDLSSEVQRRDLNPVIKFRDRFDHVYGHIRNDDSRKGQTEPYFTSAFTRRMIEDSSRSSESGTVSLGRVNQINLLYVLSGLESIWQDRLWVLQEKAMTSTFSRASEALRRTSPFSSPGFHSHLLASWERHSASMFDNIRDATTRFLEYCQSGSTHYPTSSQSDLSAMKRELNKRLASILCLNHFDRLSRALLWRTSDSYNARGQQTDRKGNSLSVSTRAPDEVALPSWSWVPDNELNWAASDPIWTTTDVADIKASPSFGMEPVHSYPGALEPVQDLPPAHIMKSVERRQIPRAHHVCLVPECKSKTFRTTSDLQRHRKEIHGPAHDAKQFNCDYPRCERSAEPFRRIDHFRDHYRDFHKEDHSASLLSPELRRLMGDENALMFMVWFSRSNLLRCPHGPWWSECPDCPWYCPDCFYCPEDPRCSCCEHPDDSGNEACPGCAECPHCLEV